MEVHVSQDTAQGLWNSKYPADWMDKTLARALNQKHQGQISYGSQNYIKIP